MTAPSASPEQDLRYPIGPSDKSSPLTAGERAQRIDAIATAPTQLRRAVAGLREEQLDTPYRPGGWTLRQVIHHVADSHINAYTRFRLGFTENNPTIKPYEEKDWAELPDVRHLSVDVSLHLLDALHERLVNLLRGMPASSFARTVVHPESGLLTMDALLSIYAWHGKHHTAHITALRQRQGWH